MCPLFFKNFLFFTKWQPFKNYERSFLFHLKSYFRYWDIQIFVFPPSPLFLPVSHCLRTWSKINHKVYDVINCLNKNLITHFVGYLKMKKSMTLKLSPLDIYSIKYGIFSWKNHTENVHQKLVPDSSRLYFFFPNHWQSYQKQRGPGTSDQSHFRL